jgi:glycosyltransferase involved in cell wall biosynthesis
VVTNGTARSTSRDQVSVIVPVHDGEPFLHECWATLMTQASRPSEIIFIDDGSTDGTLTALRSFRAAGVAVQVVSQRSLGPAAARNAGIRAASGDFIAFLDVDDAWPPNKLADALLGFAEHPEFSVVGGTVQLVWDDEAEVAAAFREPQRRVNLGAYVFRASVFAVHGLLDPTLRFAEDLDFLARLRQNGERFLELQGVSLYYRQHASNMTRGRGARDLGLFAALSKALARQRARTTE